MFVAERVGIPWIVAVNAPTASVIAEFTLLGLMPKFPVPPPAVVTLKEPPAPIVSVVAELVAFPIVNDPHTAAVAMVRFTPELMTAFSAFVGT